MDALLQVEALSKSYAEGAGSLTVLHDLSFGLKRGEIVALMGESGAGKTTLLNLLGLLDSPDSGRILFEGRDVAGFNEAERAAFRNRRVGFLFQFHFLLADFTALENVMMPGLISGLSREEAVPRAETLLTKVGLGGRLGHHPSELSGGEQQRVAAARALYNDPLVVLADEPTGNLDERNADHFLETALSLARSEGRTFLIATHSRRLAEKCDRTLQLLNGKAVQP